MTEKTELLALAERVEALSGADREVDAAIYDVCGDTPPSNGTWPFSPGSVLDDECPRFTASLDAAMGLFPEWVTYINPELCARGLPGQHARCEASWLLPDESEVRVHSRAKTLENALTAAALRAWAEGVA